MFDTVAGLPVHVLVVHAAVVLVPLAAVGTVMIAARPKLLRLFGVATVVAAGVGAGASIIAKYSGQELAGRVGWPNPHSDYGNLFPFAAVTFFVAVTVFWLIARGVPLNRNRPLSVKIFGGVLIIAAIAVTFFTVITGHTGSEATWSKVIENTRPGTFEPN